MSMSIACMQMCTVCTHICHPNAMWRLARFEMLLKMSLFFPRFNMFLLLKMSMSIAITFANHFFQGGGALRANGGCPGCCKSDRHGGPFCWDKVRPSSFFATHKNCHVHHFQLWFLVNIFIFFMFTMCSLFLVNLVIFACLCYRRTQHRPRWDRTSGCTIGAKII